MNLYASARVEVIMFLDWLGLDADLQQHWGSYQQTAEIDADNCVVRARARNE